jgi:uncharacterized protein YqhQ
MAENMKKERLPSYGGQALIEGVIMRGSCYVAAAMRAPDGKIITQSEELKGIYTSNLKKVPFLRGLLILWDALGLGMRFLTASANVQSGEDEKLEGAPLYLTITVSILVAVGLFFVAPALVGQLLEKIIHINSWWSNVVEGVMRLIIAVGYIWAIGKMPEIQRVFMYHGAEHKTINAYEDGAELTPENVAKYSLVHPRCGTAFLLTLILLSILFFSVLGPLPPLWRILTRIIFIPPLAGVAYEYIRWTAGHLDNPFVGWLIRPNLALQSLTTRQPDLSILEVSIAAFTTMIALEQGVLNNQNQEVEPALHSSKLDLPIESS